MPDARREQAARLRGQGRSLAEIGREFGITRERVRQILLGVPRYCSACGCPIDSRRSVPTCDACREAAKPLPKPPGFPAEDLSGRRFGLWTVGRRLPNSAAGRVLWECRCDCGRVKPVLAIQLRASARPKCKSCAAKDRAAARRRETPARLSEPDAAPLDVSLPAEDYHDPRE